MSSVLEPQAVVSKSLYTAIPKDTFGDVMSAVASFQLQWSIYTRKTDKFYKSGLFFESTIRF